MLDWGHIRGHGRPLKCVNRLLLHEFSDKSSCVRSVVLVHKDRSVSQWMIIKMKHTMCVKHIVVAVCHAIEVTL